MRQQGVLLSCPWLAACGNCPLRGWGLLQLCHELLQLRPGDVVGVPDLRGEAWLRGALVFFGGLLQLPAQRLEGGEAKERAASFQGMGGAAQGCLVFSAGELFQLLDAIGRVFKPVFQQLGGVCGAELVCELAEGILSGGGVCGRLRGGPCLGAVCACQQVYVAEGLQQRPGAQWL